MISILTDDFLSCFYALPLGLGWRALGLVEENEISWFWIGSHAEYDRLLKSFQ